MKRKEMTAADYHIHESKAEWEAVERWENEGGRIRQHHDRRLDSIGEEYLRHMEQAIPIGRLSKTDDIAHAMLFLGFDEAKYSIGQTLVVDGWQILPESVSAV